MGVELTNIVCLVTGAGAGIGNGLVHGFLRRGAKVGAGLRDAEKSTSQILPALPLPMDVTDADQITESVAAVIGEFGRIDVLINNAGIDPRVPADELTYDFHVMLRTDIEAALIDGSLAVQDLPEAWNAKIKEYLGLDVPNDAQGVLQDVHWSSGLVGYFPTYTLGNLYGAQFWEQMSKDVRGRSRQMAQGEFGPILAWLRTHIHTRGRQYCAEDLCKRVTGKPLSSDALVRHLKKKVAEVYG